MGVTVHTFLSNQRRWLKVLNEVKAMLHSYVEYVDFYESEHFLEVECKYLRHVRLSLPRKCDNLRTFQVRVLEGRNKTFLDATTRQSVFLVYEVFFILYENFISHLKLVHEGLEYVYPALINSNNLRRYNSVVLSKTSELQINPDVSLKLDEILDLFGILNEFVIHKHAPYIVNLLNLLVAAKRHLTPKYKVIHENQVLKSKLFEYSHVIEATNYMLSKDFSNVDTREYHEVLKTIQESLFTNLHNSFQSVPTQHGSHIHMQSQFDSSLREQSAVTLKTAEELRRFIQLQHETKSYMNQSDVQPVRMNVRSILFVFENSSNLTQISSNLKYLVEHLSYSRHSTQLAELNDTIDSTRLSKKVSFMTILTQYDLMKSINFLIQNICIILNNQGPNAYDFEILQISFYLYEMFKEFLKLYNSYADKINNGVKNLNTVKHLNMKALNLNGVDQNQGRAYDRNHTTATKYDERPDPYSTQYNLNDYSKSLNVMSPAQYDQFDQFNIHNPTQQDDDRSSVHSSLDREREDQNINLVDKNYTDSLGEHLSERLFSNLGFYTSFIFKVLYEASFSLEGNNVFKSAHALMLNKYLQMLELLFDKYYEYNRQVEYKFITNIYTEILGEVYAYIKLNSVGASIDNESREPVMRPQFLNSDYDFYNKYEWLMKFDELREYVELLYVSYVKSVVKAEKQIDWQDKINNF